MLELLGNQWVVTIAGGLIVALIVGALSHPPRVHFFNLAIGLALFAMLQMPIMLFKKSGIWDTEEPSLFWLFFEAAAVIIVITVLELRNRRS